MGNVADTTILSWITPEVDQALETVRRKIAAHLTRKDDAAALRECAAHLHQVSGALRMVGLAGATRFCEAIERSFSSTQPPTAAAIEIIDRSVVALKEFVNDLARGQPDLPMRLYPVYRDLARLSGVEESSEKDLFFPDLGTAPPPHAAPRTLAKEELGPFLHAQRARFQRGLLASLRDATQGVELMRQAIDALHQVAAQLPGPQGLWWSALALFEALPLVGDGDWLKAARAVCNRMDLHMRDRASGAAGSGETLARDVLYLVGTAPVATERVKAVRQLYRLDSLFAAPAPGAAGAVDVEFLEVALYDLHSRLDALKSAWVRYVCGEKGGAGRFRDLLSAFRAKAHELASPHLVKLLDAIALVAGRLRDPYPAERQLMVIEMASAFLLIEQVIDRFTSPPPDLDVQVTLMGGWLLDAEKGKSSGEPPAGLRPELTQQIGALQLRAQVAKEILANLREIEQILDGFARDPAKASTLVQLDAPLRQIHGALIVLGFERAAQLLSLCERLIQACQDRAEERLARDLDWIAEGLSSLAFYLTPCLHGRDPADQALTLFFTRLERARAAEDTTPGDITVTLQEAPAAEPAPADGELLAIFLDEATEVLETIASALPLCRARPEDREVLATIRRGFHTLKGSGRMVGLADLGEAAWAVERTLNRWLEQQRAATPALFELVSSALDAVRSWIGALKNDPKARIDPAAICTAADRIAQAQESAAPPSLLQIYIREAAGHAATLERELAACESGAAYEASAEFMRAAHTLASSSRTAGFAAIADLASALERWIPFSRRTAPQDRTAVRAAVARVCAMARSAARPESVGAADAECAALNDLVSRLSSLPATERRRMQDDLDPQLLPAFLEEAHELVPAIGEAVRAWKTGATDTHAPQSLQRALHTLKGSARMAGAIRLGELVHAIESRVEALQGGEAPAQALDELVGQVDRLGVEVERMRSHAVNKDAPRKQAPAGMLRVNADTLDQVLNEAGEVAIARSRAEAELGGIRQALSDLGESVARLRHQLREVEVQADSQVQSRLLVPGEASRDYDPLELDRYTRLQELTRLMAESLNDIGAIHQALLRNAGETEAALSQQARMSRAVQQALMRMRAVPFSSVGERLYRVVRQVAAELGKKAELEIEGADVELDRSVLERIAAPLEHLLRNAVVHGLEAPDARASAGKPAGGRVRLALRQESNEIELAVSDDGAGLDLDALRQKGEALGLVKPGEPASEKDLMELVFASGVSTAASVTELAGRGIGMDVVRNEIANIGGRVSIESERGRGVAITLHVPLTLAVTQAVLVRGGSSVLAIAAGMVAQVLRLKSESMAELYANGVVEAQGEAYPLHLLRHLLGFHIGPADEGHSTVLLVRAGIRRIALHVDELIGSREIVVKPVGPQLARIPGVAGATVLPDGAIALIVNPVQLAEAAGALLPRGPALVPRDDAVAKTAAPLVMVVDDSLTVRKVTSRLLEREGYRAIVAKDGVEALERLRSLRPDALLVDIEMPRMDGFELTRRVRADERLARLPIIVVSSRTAEKHRAESARLGVDAFLGKPYQEPELLEALARCLSS